MTNNKNRCFGNKPGQELYADYHDYEWGVLVSDETVLFEMLILEGAQAGLSWETILKKRGGYRKAFYNFDVEKVSALAGSELELLCKNPNIIRNRRKIYSARQNARVFLKIQKEFGSFANYLKKLVVAAPIKNRWTSSKDVPAQTVESEAISKDLKKRGMNFVGPKIIYAYMQSVGLVNDHLLSCWLRVDK
jgi:DNA-3-methyladenine glycosylase I